MGLESRCALGVAACGDDQVIGVLEESRDERETNAARSLGNGGSVAERLQSRLELTQ